jgi:hypothetical protein
MRGVIANDWPIFEPFSRPNNFVGRGVDIEFAVTRSSAHDVMCTLDVHAVRTVSSRCSAAFPVR